MTSDEFKISLEQHGFANYEDFAKEIGVSLRAVKEWGRGATKIPSTVIYIFKLLDKLKEQDKQSNLT